MNLIFIASTETDAERFEEAVEKSDFYAEKKDGLCFYFEEQDEMIDALETEINKEIVQRMDIDGYFISE